MEHFYDPVEQRVIRQMIDQVAGIPAAGMVYREFFVNAADAKATSVDFTVQLPEFPGKLVIEDNGTGATYETIVEKMVLPASGSREAGHFCHGMLQSAAAVALRENDESHYPYLIFKTQTANKKTYRVELFFDKYTLEEIKPFRKSSGTTFIVMGAGPNDRTMKLFEGADLTGGMKALNSRFLEPRIEAWVWKQSKKGVPDRVRVTGLISSAQKGLEGNLCEVVPFVTDNVKWIVLLLKDSSKAKLTSHTVFGSAAAVLSTHSGEVISANESRSALGSLGLFWRTGHILVLGEPTDGSGFKQDPTRTRIVRRGAKGTEFNPLEFADEFKKNCPKKVRDFAVLDAQKVIEKQTEYNEGQRFEEIFGFAPKTEVFRKSGRNNPVGVEDPPPSGGAFTKGLDLPLTKEHPELADLEPNDQNPMPNNIPSQKGAGHFRLDPTGPRCTVKKMGGNGSVQIDFVPTTEGELYSYGAYAAGTLTMLVNRNHPTIEWLRSTLYVSEQNASVADLWKRLDHLAKWQALSYMALHRYENKSFDTLKEKFQDCEFSRIFANPLILGRNLRDKCGKAKAMAVAVDDQQ